MSNTFLSFVVHEELFAVNVQKVLEVLQQQHITRVPNAPDYIKGIINFRGEVVPVFETRTKFNLPRREADKEHVIIVLDLSDNTELFRVGAIVDKVKDVINIEDSEIKPVPAMSKDFDSSFLKGIFKLQDNFIMLLDIDKIFSSDEKLFLKENQQLETINI
ncbi:MAG TPA: chemotaxis protein CheW [Bacteroidales bacterium]